MTTTGEGASVVYDVEACYGRAVDTLVAFALNDEERRQLRVNVPSVDRVANVLGQGVLSELLRARADAGVQDGLVVSLQVGTDECGPGIELDYGPDSLMPRYRRTPGGHMSPGRRSGTYARVWGTPNHISYASNYGKPAPGVWECIAGVGIVLNDTRDLLDPQKRVNSFGQAGLTYCGQTQEEQSANVDRETELLRGRGVTLPLRAATLSEIIALAIERDRSGEGLLHPGAAVNFPAYPPQRLTGRGPACYVPQVHLASGAVESPSPWLESDSDDRRPMPSVGSEPSNRPLVLCGGSGPERAAGVYRVIELPL